MEIFFRDDDFVWEHGSPSQLETAESCRRKWWFEKPGRLEPVYTEKQLWNFSYGTECHAAIEQYLYGDPEPIKADRYWEASVPFLDSIRQDVLALEIRMELRCPIDGWQDKLLLMGFIDVLTTTGIVDHKTTSDRKWALTPQQLYFKLQTIIYAQWYFETFGEEVCDVTLNYIQKPPFPGTGNKRQAPANWQSHVQFTAEQVDRLMHTKVWPLMQELYELDQIQQHDEVPAALSESICGKYGGCPFRDICAQQEGGRWANIQRVAATRSDLLRKFDMSLTIEGGQNGV